MSFNCLHKNLSIIFHVPLKEGGRHHPLNDLFVVYTTEPLICSCGGTVKPKYTRFMFEVTMLFVVIIRKNKLVYFLCLHSPEVKIKFIFKDGGMTFFVLITPVFPWQSPSWRSVYWMSLCLDDAWDTTKLFQAVVCFHQTSTFILIVLSISCKISLICLCSVFDQTLLKTFL